MPRLSGTETFAALQQLDASVPILLCSGYSEAEATAAFAGKGPAGFVQRPFRGQDLLDALEHIIRVEDERQ